MTAVCWEQPWEGLSNWLLDVIFFLNSKKKILKNPAYINTHEKTCFASSGQLWKLCLKNPLMCILGDKSALWWWCQLVAKRQGVCVCLATSGWFLHLQYVLGDSCWQHCPLPALIHTNPHAWLTANPSLVLVICLMKLLQHLLCDVWSICPLPNLSHSRCSPKLLFLHVPHLFFPFLGHSISLLISLILLFHFTQVVTFHFLPSVWFLAWMFFPHECSYVPGFILAPSCIWILSNSARQGGSEEQNNYSIRGRQLANLLRPNPELLHQPLMKLPFISHCSCSIKSHTNIFLFTEILIDRLS